MTPKMEKFIDLESAQAAQERRLKLLEMELFDYKRVLKDEQEKAIAEVELETEKEILAVQADANAKVLSAANQAAANTRWTKRDVQDEEMTIAGAEIKALMDGNPPVPVFDALKQVAAAHPGLTMQLAKRFLKF
jgi:regulator of protease activity HflC (stomatin/prohibitin superfamily)